MWFGRASPNEVQSGAFVRRSETVGGDDAAPAIVLLAVEFFLGGFDLLLHCFHVESRALFALAEFEERLTSPSAHR
jgi:hypothetical protein